MKKTDKRKIEEFIRVDHAGERGAIKIYEGQLLALNTIKKDENLKEIIQEMKSHEIEHSNFFDKEIKKRNIKPTKLLPLWDLFGLDSVYQSPLQQMLYTTLRPFFPKLLYQNLDLRLKGPIMEEVLLA